MSNISLMLIFRKLQYDNIMINNFIYHLRERTLKNLSRLTPFSLSGDLPTTQKPYHTNMISCLICTARSSDILGSLLNDLAQQSLDTNHFEIVLCDNSTAGHDALLKQYSSRLTIQYLRDTSPYALIGNMKNNLLGLARGETILFLDDDTRLPQKNFLEHSLHLIKETGADIILPRGEGLVSTNLSCYNFLDPYSFANRCCIYQRSLLDSLSGFRQDITAYEDIELGIRALMTKAKIIQTDQLHYQHPALFFNSLQKPLAIGQSILRLRRHYPFHIWLMIYVNALMLLPLGLWPTMKNRQWFKISLGVLLAPFTRERYSYKP
ncbi:MAG: glycosyltransferase family 2 protein [Candidatus Omnitrophica bacterium]|nr:glycosyltransferase family 2 protein [Candidatus Omnitrophota bacterium]